MTLQTHVSANPKSDWIDADVHFSGPQTLGQEDGKIQAHGLVQFDGAWLHFKERTGETITTVPASSVDRVEWKPKS